MKVCWFSSGVSSFIAAYLERKQIDKVIYTHIDDQHPDTERFNRNCEDALGTGISVLQSRYKSVDNVIQQFRFINSAHGAKCTEVLKKRVRKEWEHGLKDLAYIWGFDCTEEHRAERIKETMSDQKHIFPLIREGISKEEAHGMLWKLGIKRPAMYDLGYRNNNCIGCVKGGMGYWNKIRIDFPEAFSLRAKRERDIGRSCINGVFLDELDPNRGRFDDEVMGDCGLWCQVFGNE